MLVRTWSASRSKGYFKSRVNQICVLCYTHFICECLTWEVTLNYVEPFNVTLSLSWDGDQCRWWILKNTMYGSIYIQAVTILPTQTCGLPLGKSGPSGLRLGNFSEWSFRGLEGRANWNNLNFWIKNSNIHTVYVAGFGHIEQFNIVVKF